MTRSDAAQRLRWITIGYVIALCGLVLMAGGGRADGLFLLAEKVPGGDKTGHFVLMGTLSFLVQVSIRTARRGVDRAGSRAGLVVTALVTLEELSQVLLVARSFSLGDLAADYAGIYLGSRLARRRRG